MTMLDPRSRAIETTRKEIARRGSPRVQMVFLLVVMGVTGFSASFLLLHAGLHQMWLRYPLAAALGYAAFFSVLRLWLLLQSRRWWAHGPTDFDISFLDFFNSAPIEDAQSPVEFGGSGEFAGGGTGRVWGDGPVHGSNMDSAGGSVDAGSGFDLGADEGIIIILPLIAVLGVAVYMVVTAPALFAEVLVDGVLVAGFYNRVKRVEGRNWLKAAFRKTWVPCLLMLLFLSLAGLAMHHAVPYARSIGEVWDAF